MIKVIYDNENVFRGKKYIVTEEETNIFTKKEKDVEVIETEVNVLPKIKEKCEKCGHDTAFYWTMQTRAGDEPETKLLRCEKCKHTWRDYD